MENIIKKAIEGGWNPRPEKKAVLKFNAIFSSEFDGDYIYITSSFKEKGEDNGRSITLPMRLIVTDPLFWQSLGKASGWEEWDKKGLTWKKEWFGKKDIMQFVKEVKSFKMWQQISLNFHEINLTEGFDKAVAWLEEQIK